MTLKSLSAVQDPSGETYGVPSKLSSLITLGSLMHPMTDAFPAVDATNGPLTADTGITAGSPSTTGRTLFRWDSGVFRTQGMNWVAANTAANTSGQSAAINASTPRKYTYGTSQGFPYESNHDFAFVTDAPTVTVWYWHWTGYSGSNYHDMRWMVEDGGRLKQVRGNVGLMMPSTSTAGGGFYSRTLTFKEARERQHRIMLPANCFVVGVYIDTLATIRKAANVPMMLMNGDSWQEPNGNVLASPIGGAYPTGTFRTAGFAQEYAIATGFVTALIAQGGTGEFNCNDGAARARGYANAVGESVFHGDARIADAWAKFGAGAPIWRDMGGWNDGDLPGSPFQSNYQSRVADGLAAVRPPGSSR